MEKRLNWQSLRMPFVYCILLNDTSLAKFLELLEDFGECSGIRINQDKSEIILLGECSNLLPDHLVIRLEINMESASTLSI